MTWQKFDDRARENRKIRQMSPEAFQLWWAIGNWCCAHETDGFIPKTEVRDAWRPIGRRFNYVRAEALLIQLGALIDHGDRYEVRDFLRYNLSRAESELKRENAAKRQEKHRCHALRDALVTRDTERDASVSHTLPSRPVINDHETDLDQVAREPPDSGVRARSSDDPNPSTRAALLRGYQRRYESVYGDAWLSHGKAASDVDVVARWCDSGPDPRKRVDTVLDGAFADPWLAKRRVPWGPIAKDPAKYAAPPAADERADAAAEPDDDAPPKNYHPVTHGWPKWAVHDRIWDAWVADGKPNDPGWQPPWKRAKVKP